MPDWLNSILTKIENLGMMSVTVLKRVILNLLDNYEPRISVQEVRVGVISNGVEIAIDYIIINGDITATFGLILDRSR